jgi:hypothetical protein
VTSKPSGPFYRAEAELRRIPGVLGVGLAHKQTRDGVRDQLAFVVVVPKKRHKRELKVSELIPPWFEGVPTDVWEPFDAPLLAEPSTILNGGIEIRSNRSAMGASGTLGCLATRGPAGPTQEQFLLSAHHVFYEDFNETGEGGDVGAPDLSCCWICVTGKVANVTAGVGTNNLDCAIAKTNGKRPIQQRIPKLGPTIPQRQNSDLVMGVAPLRDVGQGLMSPIAVGEHVRKVGASSGLTGGTVFALNLPVPADGESGYPAMDGQIIIKPLQNEGRSSGAKVDFAIVGDSGAVIMDDANRVVGLLSRAPGFAPNPPPPDPPPPPWMGRGGAANDIHKVIAALNIAIPASKTAQLTPAAGAILPGSGVFKFPPLRQPELEQRAVLEELKDRMREFGLGRKLVNFIEIHQPEIARLINHDRRVTSAWHRAHGPAFLALLLKDLRSAAQPIPKQVNGATLASSLSSMRSALDARGSAELRAELPEVWNAVARAASRSETLGGLVDELRMVDAHA